MSALSGVVQVFQRQVYGQPKVYPANHAADLLASIAGVKTFNNQQLQTIRELGLTIEQVKDPQGAIAGTVQS
jgi:hypothetical protein